MNATHQLVKSFSRKTPLLLGIHQRPFHSSLLGLKNTAFETNFAEALTDKFIDQVKKQRQQHQVETSRFVQIESLPITVTLEDVNKLAREAFPQGDKSIVEVVFCRKYDFSFTGRCIISLDSCEDARRLVEYGDKRVLGGKTLRMHYINNDISNYRVAELSSTAGSPSAAGRSVVISGFPAEVKIGNVLRHLRARSFSPNGGITDNVKKLYSKKEAHSSKFLVKFASESEAWRCVRAFHNTDYFEQQQKKKFKLHLNVAY